MTIQILAEWHRTILWVIILCSLAAAAGKIWALKCRWRDGMEVRRIILILTCLYCAWVNILRVAGLAVYDPTALTWGAVYIVPLLLVGVLWLAATEWC